jgi:hypothetical protein
MIRVAQARVTYELECNGDRNADTNPAAGQACPIIEVPRDVTAAVIRAQFSTLNTVKLGPETDFSDSSPYQIALW